MKRLLVVLSSALLGVGLAACGSDEGGTAVPANSGSAQTSPESNSHGAPSSSAQSDSASLDPCGLLSDSELARFGDFDGVKPERGENLGARYCTWDVPGMGGVSLEVDIRDKQGVDEARDTGSGIVRDEVEGRKIARIPGDAGCTVAVEITDSSRVDIQGLKGTDPDASCELATKVAQIVEPKLPEG